MSLGIVIGLFVASFTAHVLAHRILAAKHIHNAGVISVYGAGLGVFIVMWRLDWFSYPITAALLYVLLSAVSIFFYLPRFLGGETPTSMMIASFATKKEQSLDNLISLFSNTGLIWKRIENLMEAGYIKKTGTKMMATTKGYILFYSIKAYQKIFYRVLTG